MAIVSKCKYCGISFTPYFKKKSSGCCSRYCYTRQYYIENKEQVDKTNKRWYVNNKKRANVFAKKSRENRKVEILEHYGGAYCSICEVGDVEILTLDHVAGGGTKQRRKFKDGHAIYRWIINNNYPGGFRVLCRNCNWKEYLKQVRK